MTGRLAGKVVLVTGAGGGKGLALARVLSGEGARLVIGDVNEEGGQRNAAEFGPDVVRFIRLDVTQEADWGAAMAFVRESYGKLDVLVNSARIHTRNPDLATTSLESWREQTAVNLDGAFLGMKHALPLMRAGGGGSIVNVVSLSAVAPFAPTPVYSASHAALLNLTKTVAVNSARAGENIRANAVLCGMSINSPVDAVHEVAKKLIPIGRPANAEDIARAILWFASDESSYVTGSSVTLDGGYTAESYPGA
jgi:NAD(P)-dependent dehydrogenase (short-subunit alcohol dehydrogenase family)